VASKALLGEKLPSFRAINLSLLGCLVGPNEETVAAGSQTVAHDPIAMGKLLQQDACRVRSVVPETPSKTNAVVGSVVLDNVVPGR